VSGESGEVVILARGLGRSFGRRRAVDGIDLAVRRGEVFGLLGPNGAGKSTLLRMLVGLLPPTAGSVEVLGHALPRRAEALRSRVGYMPQRFSLYEDLSVAENLEFAAAVYGFDREESARRIAESLDEHGLAGRSGQRAGQLSGGWQQRLALAAATVHHPELLVLDEPTAGVDPEQRRRFWEKLFALAADGATLLVTTHSMDEAERCHRLALLREGRLAALGSPRELTAALSHRVVEVEAEEPEAAVAALRATHGVESVTQLGDAVHVLLTASGPDAPQAVPGLIAGLAAAGFTGVRARPAAPILEDVFVASGHRPAPVGEAAP
jgi:ABC-2 type transport system ATP-binding protein